MNSSIAWLAGLFITSITLNVSLLKIIYDDYFDRPNLIALIVNALLSLVGAIFGTTLVGPVGALAFVIFNVSSFLTLVYFTKRRTVYALKVGEKLLSVLKTIDLQIIYILNELHNGGLEDQAKPIRRSLRFILSELPDILGLDGRDRPQLCVLVPNGNKFRVVAYERIESFRIEAMQQLFQHGPNTVSVAGQAMSQKKPVIINDLAKSKEPYSNAWVETHTGEAKNGSIIAFPILRGLALPAAEPIAILCITSVKRNAFRDENALIRILTYFSVKIEILQSCLDLTNH